MNAFASSSTSLLPALRHMRLNARGMPSVLGLGRPAALSSRTFLPPSTIPSSRFTHSRTSSTPAIPSHQPISPQRLLRDLNPILIGSPSGYLLRRAFTTSPSTRYPPPTPAAPKSARTQSEDPSEEDDAEPDPNLSALERLKLLFKRYGWYALGMYTVLSALDFSLCFVLIHLAGAERIEPVLESVGGWYRRTRYGEERADEIAVEQAIEAEEERKRAEAEEREGKGSPKKKSGWLSRTVLAEMALAYPIHKVALLPVRAGLTVAWTPKFVGWLTRRGWVGKGGYTRAASHAQDKIRTAKERVKERVQDLKQ